MTTLDGALDLLAGLVLEDGRTFGDAAVAEQWEDARAVLAGETPYFYFTRARGYSKTSDLAAILIVVMLVQLPPGSRLYGLASDRDQGRLLIDAVAGFVTRTAALAGSLVVDSYKATAKNGSVLEVLAADAAGAWGLRPAFAVVDELAAWDSTRKPRKLWEAMTSAMAKVPGSRLVVLTSSGDPSHWSCRVLEHAYQDPLWCVHEIKGPSPWSDPERLAEQKRRLPASSYARLFENLWVTSEDRLTSLDDLRACVTLDGPQPPAAGRSYAIGVDLGIKKDRTCAAICHAERVDGDTTIVLDRMAVWEGSRAAPVDLNSVEEWLRESSRLYNAAPIVGDPWQAIGMFQRLRAKGVRVTEFAFSQQSVGRLAVTLHTTIRDHRLALPDDEELLDELANIRLKEVSPTVFRMDHDPDKHDDRGIALSLAAQQLLEHAPRRGHRMQASRWIRDGQGHVIGFRDDQPIDEPSLTAIVRTFRDDDMPPCDEENEPTPGPVMPESTPGRAVVNLGTLLPAQPRVRPSRVIASEVPVDPAHLFDRRGRRSNPNVGPPPDEATMAQVARFNRLTRHHGRRKDKEQ